MQGEIKGIMKRNATILIIVIICTGIFASNYGGTIPYALFYFSLLVPLMSFIYILIVLNFFRFHQEAAKKTFVKGETVDYFFHYQMIVLFYIVALRLISFIKNHILLE